MSRSNFIARGVFAALSAGALATGAPAAAQQAPARAHQAVRIDRAPELDGRLDDAAWATAPVLSDFVQKEPVEGARPTERTEIRFVYDDEALYVGARMYADDADAIQAPLTRRDEGGLAEHLTVSLDTYLDRRTAYTFGVTAAGVRLDRFHPTDAEYNRDESFDPVWRAAVARDSAGWTAEMRIPFSQLRFTDRAVQTWGMNINRWIPSREEDVYWIAIPRGVTAWASRFGTLAGIAGIRPARRAELVPYVAAEGTRYGAVDADDPFAAEREGTVRMGGEARIGLGPSLMLEATLNPDFGQVEADPAEVNLSAFETVFDEKRPFFTEGARYLRGSGATWFHSRRIGAAPRVPVDADYADYPRSSTILGAAKLTGRTAGGLSIGALAALTDRAEARYLDAEGGVRALTVAPRAGWGVVRALQEFGADASTAGVTVTAVRRDLEDGGVAEAWLPRTALSAGADWNLRFRGGDYELSGFAGGSWVEGDSLAILRVQTAPAHYFQRPHRDYAVLDPSRTALGGYTAGLSLQRNNARHWLWNAGVTAISPGLDLNETGRTFVADLIEPNARLTYRETEPGRWYRGYEVHLRSDNGFDFDGLRRHGQVSLIGEMTWSNYWFTNVVVQHEMRILDGSATRGGPRLGLGPAWSLEAAVGNAFSSRTQWSVEGGAVRSGQGRRGWGAEVELSMVPTPQWRFSVEPGYRRERDPRQYVARLAGGPEATQGFRYLFAHIERSEIAAELRMSYLFSPDLSLEVYAEPFAASGRYTRFGQVPAPRAFGLDFFDDGQVVSCEGTEAEPCSPGAHVFTATEDGTPVTIARDFNVRSFRSNAVLRWEWRPGSTLYLVWQQDRGSRTPDGAYVGPGALGDALSAPGDNFVAMKVTYWIPL